MNTPQLSLEERIQLQQLDASFHRLFVEQQALKDIQTMLHALETELPILEIAEGPRGSFASIFQPFHREDPAIGRFLQRLPQGHPLLSFCDRAAAIEGMTDQFAKQTDEPSSVERAALRALLVDFIEHIPSPEAFSSWLSEVERGGSTTSD